MRYFTILITCSPVQTHSSLSFVHVWWPRRANIYFWETEHGMSNQMCFNLFTYVHGLSVYVCLCSRLFFPSARDLLLNFSLKTHHRGYYTRFGGLQMRMWFWLLWLNIFSLRLTNTRTAHNHFGTQISENGGNIHSTPFCPTAHKIQLTKN